MAVIDAIVCVPETAFAPVHAPLAVHAVAFVDDQVNVDEAPDAIVSGLALSVTDGAGLPATPSSLRRKTD